MLHTMLKRELEGQQEVSKCFLTYFPVGLLITDGTPQIHTSIHLGTGRGWFGTLEHALLPLSLSLLACFLCPSFSLSLLQTTLSTSLPGLTKHLGESDAQISANGTFVCNSKAIAGPLTTANGEIHCCQWPGGLGCECMKQIQYC